MTTPLLSILDRDKAARDVANGFSDHLSLLRDVVNYGTNLIPRCLESSSKGVADVVVLGALTKQAVALLDGFEVLVSKGAVLASHLSVRGLFEATLYVSWILASDTERRAKQYYVWNLRQRRLWAARVLPRTPEHQDLKKSLQQVQQLQDFLDSPDIQKHIKDAQEEIARIDTRLSSPNYSQIDHEFDRIRGKSKFDKPWHAPWGVRSIRQMANALDRLAEYDLVYSQLSDVTHSTALRTHVTVGTDDLTLEPIRYLESIDDLLRKALTLSFRLYREVLEHYRPEEVQNFDRKYTWEWRDRVLAIPRVAYSRTPEPRP